MIVKRYNGRLRCVVGCHSKVNKEKLIAGTRVALDMSTLAILRILPREVYPSTASGSFVVQLITTFTFLISCLYSIHHLAG